MMVLLKGLDRTKMPDANIPNDNPRGMARDIPAVAYTIVCQVAFNAMMTKDGDRSGVIKDSSSFRREATPPV